MRVEFHQGAQLVDVVSDFRAREWGMTVDDRDGKCRQGAEPAGNAVVEAPIEAMMKQISRLHSALSEFFSAPQRDEIFKNVAAVVR